MTFQNLLKDCQFCSVVSKANSEDPIGTATFASTWIIVEIAQPWTKASLMAHPALSLVFQELRQGGGKLMPMAIAPDSEYSVSGFTRVLHYQRPGLSFAQLDKQEFLVPDNQLAQLTRALLQQPNKLNHFEMYKQSTSHIREMMICTHGNIDVACARFGYPIYQKLRQEYAASSNGELRVWRCSHFGGHQFAPTLFDLPTGQFWGHLEPEMLDCLVRRETPVKKLHRFYRGWVGLTKFEQIVEREIWMQRGWEWLNYNKSGQVLARDKANEEWDADWAEIRLDFTSPDGSVQGAYEARVEVCDRIMTAINSGKDQPLQEVKQYRVSRLTPMKSD
ncbi:MAG: sucrase ferredoxin [Symploca sp. SIO2E9]|nr:sucrase ferredoxin [Symploca sp. SIO2E9]